MNTAFRNHGIAAGLRTFVLAGTLAISTVLPNAAFVFADSGSTTDTSAGPVLTQQEAFTVDPAAGLFDIQAVAIGGDAGVPLLESPRVDAPVVETIDDGTLVDVRIDKFDSVVVANGKTRFWPVDVGGSSGWVDGQSLMSPENYAAWSGTNDGSSTQSRPGTRVPFDFTGDLNDATAQVDANGEGLVMRAAPDGNSEVVEHLNEGTIVDLRIADVDTVYDSAGTRWWPVSHNGVDGWVSGMFLITPGSTPQSGTVNPGVTNPSQSKPGTSTGDYTYKAGDWAVVRTSDGGRTNLYSQTTAASNPTGSIPDMALVEILAQADGGWYEVRWDQVTGYISGDYLTAGTAPRRSGDTPAPAPTPTPSDISKDSATSGETDPLTAGDTAVVKSDSGSGVNVRSGAGSDNPAAGFLADGSRVTIVSGPKKDASGAGWYEINAAGMDKGWVRADLLAQVVATTETTTSGSNAVSAQGFILPLDSYRFTQDFGCSSLGFYSYDANWGCAVHDGLDLAAPAGTPIKAAAAGTVVVSGWCNCGLGYYVEIDHGNGIHTLYGHQIEQPPVVVGQQVKQGEVIGHVGSTGLSTGPHTHFMVRKDGVTVDPKNYVPPVKSN